MGKYFGSPWGFIRGKLDDAVGGVWKGVEWNRVRIFPTQRGTLEKYRAYKDGHIHPEAFSFKQMNIRRTTLQVQGHIGRSNLPNLIYPVWQALCTKRMWTMTGINAFVKRSAARFYNSMPHKDEEYDPETNAPDMCELLVSDGDLEGAAPLTCTYDTATGDLVITWDSTTYTNGDDSDFAFCVVLKKHSVETGMMEEIGRDGNWYPSVYLYGTAILIPPPGVPPKRLDGTLTMSLPPGLDISLLTAYLFFRDVENLIGYSPSNCCVELVPPSP